jgi:hypothetical protein
MRKLNPFKPTDIGGCQLWLDAADRSTFTLSGLNILQWNDKSGLGQNATAVGTIPLSSSINGISTPRYSLNTNTYFSGTSINTGSTLSAFAVYVQNNNSTANNRIVSLGTLGTLDWNNISSIAAILMLGTNFVSYRNSSQLGSIAGTFGVPSLSSSISTGQFNTFYLNGTAGTTVASSGNFNYSTYFIGSTVGEQNVTALSGTIGEVILYNTALTDPQRQQVEGYLAQKWGLQPNLPAGTPGRTGVIYPRSPLIDGLTTGQATLKPYIRALLPVFLGGSFQFTTTPSQYLSIPNSTAFTQNTAFTYELWYYPTSTNSGYLVAMLQHNWITVKWNTGTAGTIGLDMSYVGNPPGYVAQNRIYAINRWHHIALTWNGTNGVLYMNGVSEAVFTGAGGLVNAGNDLRIGQYQGQGQPTPLGYFTNIRFVKGVSVYTGAFTPPTAPLSVTQSAGTNISAITAGQTQLLISATTSGSLLTDSSTNNFTITNNGSVAWNALTPFS